MRSIKLWAMLGLLLSLVSCVGTIEEAEGLDNSTIDTPNQNFSFLGIDEAGYVDETKAWVYFKPATGGSGQFTYQVIDSKGVVRASAESSELIKYTDGRLGLTALGLEPGEVHSLLVRATDSNTEIPDTNTKYIAVGMPGEGEFYNPFSGISSCENFPGINGQTRMLLNAPKAKFEMNGFFPTEDSVGAYKIYICEVADGTDCLFTDGPDRRTVITPVSQSSENIDQHEITGLTANTSYYFRITVESQGDQSGNGKKEDRNIKFTECRTQAGGNITFAGIETIEILDGEDGISQATAGWQIASGAFEGYRVFYHRIPNESGVFSYTDPDIKSTAGIIDPVDVSAVINGMEPFSWHAVLVKACEDIVNDPACINGNDGGGKFLVVETRPDLAFFAGIDNVTNDPLNPSKVNLNFNAANFSFGGIMDEYRVFIKRSGVDYDITDTDAVTTLGTLYPAAPAELQTLFLEGFNKINVGATTAKLAGLQAGIVYSVDILPYVDRTVTISGTPTLVEYTDISMSKPTNVSNTDTTPPQIQAVVASPISGILGDTDTLEFRVTYDELLVVTGAPRVGIDVGGSVRYADYISGDGTNELLFRYTVSSPDNDLDGLALSGSGISLNLGTIQDLSGNDAVLDFGGLSPNLTSLFVDTIPPDPPTNVQIDSAWVTSMVSPNITWTNPSADFSFAEVGIGTSPGSVNVQPYVTASSTSSHSFASLSLIQCLVDYYATVRSVDSAGLGSNGVSSATTFKLDSTAPTPVTVINILTPTTSTVETVEISWDASNDSCAFAGYELAVGFDDDADGFDAGDIDNTIGWSTVPGGAVTLQYKAVDGVDGFNFNLVPGVDYKISIRGVDEAGNASAPFSSADWEVDIVGPSAPTGLALSSDWISGALPQNSPTFSWINPTEPDFLYNEVYLGTTNGGNDIVGNTNVSTSTNYVFNGLTGLVECAQSYPTVQSFDNLSNGSAPATRLPGFRWDNTAPVMGGSVNIAGNQGPDRAPTATWATGATDNCQFSSYEISLGTSAGADDVVAWLDVGNVLSYQITDGVDGVSFAAGHLVNYFINVRGKDAAGNVGSEISSAAWNFNYLAFDNGGYKFYDLSVGASCRDYDATGDANGGVFPDGIYWVNPTGGSEFRVFCDQTTQGGGWTLVLKYDSNLSTTGTWALPAGSLRGSLNAGDLESINADGNMVAYIDARDFIINDGATLLMHSNKADATPEDSSSYVRSYWSEIYQDVLDTPANFFDVNLDSIDNAGMAGTPGVRASASLKNRWFQAGTGSFGSLGLTNVDIVTRDTPHGSTGSTQDRYIDGGEGLGMWTQGNREGAMYCSTSSNNNEGHGAPKVIWSFEGLTGTPGVYDVPAYGTSGGTTRDHVGNPCRNNATGPSDVGAGISCGPEAQINLMFIR